MEKKGKRMISTDFTDGRRLKNKKLVNLRESVQSADKKGKLQI